MKPIPTGYWREEKDAEGKTKRIFELMNDGSEVETGYKHAHDDIGTVSLVMSILVFIAFIPVCIIGTVREWWRWRK